MFEKREEEFEDSKSFSALSNFLGVSYVLMWASCHKSKSTRVKPVSYKVSSVFALVIPDEIFFQLLRRILCNHLLQLWQWLFLQFVGVVLLEQRALRIWRCTALTTVCAALCNFIMFRIYFILLLFKVGKRDMLWWLGLGTQHYHHLHLTFNACSPT